MTNTNSATDKAWTLIEEEKNRDRKLQRIAKTAWAITLTVVVLYGVLTAIQVWEMMRSFLGGLLPMSTAVAMATPFLIALGIMSVLVATVTTIGTFMRLRTTSLHEIQLRLAALEEMIAAQGERR
jgi:putative flippase GtrA